MAASTASTTAVKTAVITGANRGLGLELVRQMCDKVDIGKIYALCRSSSDKLKSLSNTASTAGSSTTKVIVVEDIDVTSDAVGDRLRSVFQLENVNKDPNNSNNTDIIPIDLLIHNAGAYSVHENFADEAAMYASQKLESITMDRMRGSLEINTLGPLRVTQALLPNIKATSSSKDTSETGDTTKIIIISSAMSSIAENTSGGHYGYRTAKAGANMIGKSFAMDLKQDNIAVGMIHPGFVLTGFDNNRREDKPAMKRRKGQRDVEPSATGVLQAIDMVTMETTGSFWHGNYAEGVKPLPW